VSRFLDNIYKLFVSKNDDDNFDFWYKQTQSNPRYLQLRKQWNYFALFLTVANILLIRIIPELAHLLFYLLQAFTVILYRVYFWVRWYMTLPAEDKQQYRTIKKNQLWRFADLLLLALTAFLLVVAPLIGYAIYKSRH
jgi:hypothetical protein